MELRELSIYLQRIRPNYLRFSGVAWAYSKDPEQITTVTSWAGKQAFCSDKDKAPTAVHFTEDGQSMKWGYQATDCESPFRWFKLLLLRDTDVDLHILNSPQYKQSQQTMANYQNNPTEVITCYLRELWDHTLDEIKKATGPSTLAICELYVVVTLPAIWPAYAQASMMQAIDNAGIRDDRPMGRPEVYFIREPEAAALASINDVMKRCRLKVRIC